MAVGQLVSRSAQGLCIIPAQAGIPQWQDIDKLINQWQPHALIVGLPLNMDGSQQPVTTLAQQFAQSLSERYACLVHHVDERLTTLSAKQQLYRAKKHQLIKSNRCDHIAAQLILETWLQSENSL